MVKNYLSRLFKSQPTSWIVADISANNIEQYVLESAPMKEESIGVGEYG